MPLNGDQSKHVLVRAYILAIARRLYHMQPHNAAGYECTTSTLRASGQPTYHASRTTSTGTNAVVPVPTRPYVNARICVVICSIHVYLPHRVQLKLDAKQRASPIHRRSFQNSHIRIIRIPLCVQSSPAHFPAFHVNHPVKTPLTKYMLLTCNASESINVTPIYDADL